MKKQQWENIKKEKNMKTKEISGLLKVVCPKCKNRFGLDTKLVERFGEANMRYKCPYCTYEAGLK